MFFWHCSPSQSGLLYFFDPDMHGQSLISGTRSRLLLGIAVVMLLVASCATGPKPSDVILARDALPLLDRQVRFQRMYGNKDGATDRLDVPPMPRRLVVTATELTMPGGNGNELTPWEFTLSFAIVKSVEVKRIHYDPFGPLGAGRMIESAVVITEERGVCRDACVFIFSDDNGEPDLAAANRLAALVREGHASVDAFGRKDGPRPVATAIGLRSPRPVWRSDISAAPDPATSAARDIERKVLEYAKSVLRQEFSQCLVSALNTRAADKSAWTFLSIENIGVKDNTELDISSVIKSEQLKTLGSNSMLVSDIYGLGFVYIPPDENDPARVETTFRAFVDFYDLEPLKDGRYFWFDYSQQRLFEELAADPVTVVRQDTEAMCHALSDRIAEELEIPTGT